MKRLAVVAMWVAGVVGLLFSVGAGENTPHSPAVAKQAAEPYDGFKADQAMLRTHLIHKSKNGGKDIKASSVEACQAARRIFSRLSFLFRTREEVLDLLGDPATVSDYNQPADKNPSSPLMYVFDTGFGGGTYIISFDSQRKVNQVRADSLE